MQDEQISNAAAVALYSGYSEEERERADAAKIEILRNSGIVGENVAGLGEAKTKRAAKKTLEKKLTESFAAGHLCKFEPKNPTSKDDAD